MSVTTYIKFLRSKDDPTYQKYLKVLEACDKAGVDYPDDIAEYFGEDGDPEYPLEVEFEPKRYIDDMEEIWEIKVSDIPEGVVTIQFVNSY